jgi:hypothetical protein
MDLEFKWQKWQSVFFVGNFSLTNKLKIVNNLNECTENLFNGEPTIVTLPAEAPPSLPRIILRSSNNNYSLHFSNERIDFFYENATEPKLNLESLKSNYFKYWFNIAKNILDNFNINISRVACVVKIIIPIKQLANLFLFEKFLSSNKFFDEAFKLEIHALEKRNLDNFEINRWFRIKSIPEETEKEILIEIDVNTLAEKPLEFNFERINQFYDKIIPFIENNLNRCFKEV